MPHFLAFNLADDLKVKPYSSCPRSSGDRNFSFPNPVVSHCFHHKKSNFSIFFGDKSAISKKNNKLHIVCYIPYLHIYIYIYYEYSHCFHSPSNPSLRSWSLPADIYSELLTWHIFPKSDLTLVKHGVLSDIRSKTCSKTGYLGANGKKNGTILKLFERNFKRKMESADNDKHHQNLIVATLGQPFKCDLHFLEQADIKPWDSKLSKVGKIPKTSPQKPSVPSGKLTKNDGKSPFLMGKSTIHGPFSIAMWYLPFHPMDPISNGSFLPDGWTDGAAGFLTTEEKPFNVFARAAGGSPGSGVVEVLRKGISIGV